MLPSIVNRVAPFTAKSMPATPQLKRQQVADTSCDGGAEASQRLGEMVDYGRDGSHRRDRGVSKGNSVVLPRMVKIHPRLRLVLSSFQ